MGAGGKKAIVIFVPVPQLKAFQKIQVRLVRELEKKFSGKHVVFIAQRKILAKPTRKANKLKQKRPRSRTLVSVHNALLDDLVYPAEIIWQADPHPPRRIQALQGPLGQDPADQH